MAKGKPKSTAARAAKAIDKARGFKTYSIEAGGALSSRGSAEDVKTRKKVRKGISLGAASVDRTMQRVGKKVYEQGSISKTDAAALNKKTRKASGTTYKSTARQIKLDRERTATRAAAIAKREANKKKK